MATKLIRNVDDDTWRKFVGLCKIKNKRVGDLLTEILEKELENELVKSE